MGIWNSKRPDGPEPETEQPDRLRKIGLVAGLDNASLDACLADEEQARKLVAWFQKNSTEDDVTGTPTLIIDGEKHSNMNYGDLKAILDAKLES